MQLRPCFALAALLVPTAAFAAATISGSEEEVRRLLVDPPETINLVASATMTLAPKSAIIHAGIEVEARTFAELLKLTSDKKTAITTALVGFTPVFAETFEDPANAIEMPKLKRLALRTDFKVALTNPADGDKLFSALGAIANVDISDVELVYDPAADLGAKLLDRAAEDLARQKAFYEATFNVELKLRSFVPFNAPERGGDEQAEEEMVVLSPFSVEASRRSRFRAKSRVEEIVVHKIFESRQVVKQISAVYEIHPK